MTRRPAFAAAVLVLACGGVRADGDDEDMMPPPPPPVVEPLHEGTASWYGGKFHGRQTACGETFDENGLTAAHRSLPFGTRIAVTNLDNGCTVTLRVTDRGPYHGDRILDLSRGAAEHLGFVDRGVARVRWEIVPTLPPSQEQGLRLGLWPVVATQSPLRLPPPIVPPAPEAAP